MYSIEIKYKNIIENLINNRDVCEVSTIVNLGLTCNEMVKKYNNFQLNNLESNIIYVEELKQKDEIIKNLKYEISRIETNVNKLIYEKDELERNEKNTSLSKIQKYEEEKIKVKNEYELTINNLQKEINEQNLKNEKNKFEEIISVKKEYDEEIKKLKKSIDDEREKNMECEKIFYKKLNEENDRIRKEKNEKIEMKDEELRMIHKEIDKKILSKENYFKELIEEFKETFSKERENYEKKMIEYEKEIEKYKKKYDKIEINSTLKGKGYEYELEKDLIEYFDKKSNVYRLENCSGMKGKGDFIVTNNYSNIRIMIEAKNMEKVKAYDENQLPKFYNDLNDKTNKYDGGIMICSGVIATKSHYLIEVNNTNNKISSFIENYKLNGCEYIYSLIELIHNYIVKTKNTDALSKDKILDMMVLEYKELNIVMKNIKESVKLQEILIKEKRDNIQNLFSINVEEYIKKKSAKNHETSKTIKNRLEETIIKNHKIMKKSELSEKIILEFKEYIELYNKKKDKINGIPKSSITKMINKYYNTKEITIEN